MRWQQLQADGHFIAIFSKTVSSSNSCAWKAVKQCTKKVCHPPPATSLMGWHSFLPSICLPRKNDTALMSEWLKTSPGYSMPWIQLPKLQCQAKHLQLISFAWNSIRGEKQSRVCPHSTLSTTSTTLGENPFFLHTVLSLMITHIWTHGHWLFSKKRSSCPGMEGGRRRKHNPCQEAPGGISHVKAGDAVRTNSLATEALKLFRVN